MDNETFTQLQELAFDILHNDLEKYGNHPGENQLNTLGDVLTVYSLTATGSIKGRQVLPLPTGFGKTLSIVAWITALHKLGIDNVSVVVGAYKVEALCDIKRSLIDHGVPEKKIGLIHSYEHHPYPVESPDQLPPGRASLPSTGNNHQRQVVLMTHNRVKGFGKIPDYRGRSRNLIIWDESLIKSEPLFVEAYKLHSVYGALRPYTKKPELRSASMDGLFKYLGKCLTLINAEIKHVRDNTIPRCINLPELSEGQVEDFFKVVDSLNPKEIGNLESLRAIIELSQKPARVVYAGKAVVVGYEVVFPVDLNNVIVLDASYNFRELVQMDSSMRKTGRYASLNNLVSYENVTIHYYQYPSGRDSLTEQFKGDSEKRVVCIEVAEVIRKIPEDQGVLIFTFKKRDIDFIDTLKQDLLASGVDPGHTLPNGKNRVNFLTWGNETSLSSFNFCENVVFVGVLHRSKPDIACTILGQKDNLLYNLADEEIDMVMRSEKLHHIYQAMCRGSCRIVNNDKASPMNIWLFDRDQEVKEALSKIMPGVKWKAWENTRLERRTRQQEIANTIGAFLDTLSCEETKISTSALKKRTGLTVDYVPKKTFSYGLKLFLDHNTEWSLKGRTLIRLTAGDYGFIPVEGSYVYSM
jgi:hypothetical protein